MFQAFRHFLKNKWRLSFSMPQDIDLMVAAFILYAILLNQKAFTSLPVWDLFSNSVKALMIVGGYFVYTTIIFYFAQFMAAVVYSLKFYGKYEIIKEHFGYRAFRLNREQQGYLQFYYEGYPVSEEKIIASANVDTQGTLWCVLSPGRHHHCIAYMFENGMNEESQRQGFLTNHYRFVGREEARAMAIANGQCPTPDHVRELFSEDLWDTPEHLQYKG